MQQDLCMRQDLSWILIFSTSLGLAAASLGCRKSPSAPAQPPAPPESMDFTFSGKSPAGGQTFHHFTAAHTGLWLVSVEWETTQTTQTVCIGRSDYADYPATCAPSTAGRLNSVLIFAQARNPFTVYAIPDRSADAAYAIRVKLQ